MPTSRREFVALSAALGLFGSARGQQEEQIPVWIARNPISFVDRPYNVFLAPDSQVAVEGRGSFQQVVVSESARQLRAQPALAGLKLDGPFNEGLQDRAQSATPLVKAADEATAQVRIVPTAILRDWERDTARLVLLTQVSIAMPGHRRSTWTCWSETASVLPNHGLGSWIADEAAALKAAVRFHASELLLAVEVECRMRRRGEWKDPADVDKLVEIKKLGAPPNMYGSYLQIAETSRSLVLVGANKSLGHLQGRFILDKTLIGDIRKPS